MQLIGQAIRHKVYGKGIVTSCDKNIITVCFPPDTNDSFIRMPLPNI